MTPELQRAMEELARAIRECKPLDSVSKFSAALLAECRDEILSHEYQTKAQVSRAICEHVHECHSSIPHIGMRPPIDILPPMPNCPVCGKTMYRLSKPNSVHHPARLNTDDPVVFIATCDCGICCMSEDFRGPYIHKRVSAVQDGKTILAVDFWLRGKRLEMQVVEQAEELRTAEKEIVLRDKRPRLVSSCGPRLLESALYLRGREGERDTQKDSWVFGTPALALAALRKWMEVIPQVRLPKAKAEPSVRPQFVGAAAIAAGVESWKHWRRHELGLAKPQGRVLFRACLPKDKLFVCKFKHKFSRCKWCSHYKTCREVEVREVKGDGK